MAATIIRLVDYKLIDRLFKNTLQFCLKLEIMRR